MSENRVPELVALFGEAEYERVFEQDRRYTQQLEVWRGMPDDVKFRISGMVVRFFGLFVEEFKHQPEQMRRWERKVNGVKRWYWTGKVMDYKEHLTA